MDEKLSKRIKYLVLFLLNLRSDTKRVNGYTAPAIFNIDEIKSPEFSYDNNEKKLNEIMISLEEIKNSKLQNPGEYPYTAIEEIKLEEDNKTIELKEATTDNLLRYVHKKLNKGNSIFGFSTNNEHQQVLTFLDKKTSVKISSKPQWILSYLLKHPNKDVPYKTLFNEIKISGGVGKDYLALQNNESKKMKFINDGVDQLRKKLDNAVNREFKGIKLKTIENKRYRGKGDEPGVYKLLI